MSSYKFNTGIEELDKMLGVNKGKKGEKIYNKIVLIKGGPGSGKTTLGLQIINNHLKTENNIAGYVSLEIEPNVSCDYVENNFCFNEFSKDSGRFYRTSKKELIDSLRDYYNPETLHSPKISDVIFSCLRNGTGKKLENDNACKIIFFDSLNVLIELIHSVVDKDMNDREIIKSICDINREADPDSTKDKNTIFIFSVEYHPVWGLDIPAILTPLVR
jgi:KaiC/GvpD/RAD55 family RecA-like ATPase